VRRKNPRVRLSSQMDGGGHERGIRSGTLNVPAIVGFGKACELCKTEMQHDAERNSKQRNKLEKELAKIKVVSINGNIEYRLPNVSNISFKNINSSQLMAKLSKKIAVSSGSACTSASQSPSFVLKAMGLSNEMTLSSIRFSLGRFTTDEEVDFTIHELTQLIS
jgi:cysteine desulfurase